MPHLNRDVHGLAGPQYPKYTVGPLCCHPHCSKPADHAHHLWRRSALGGPFDWVELWDGRIMGNIVGICWMHHQRITDNTDAIVLLDNKFMYLEQGAIVGQLKGGPPGHDQPNKKVVGPAAIDRCPSCNRPLPHDSHEKKEAKRRRKSWVVQVPDDKEDGATVLDTLIDACREIFSHDENPNTRYFTLVQALALVVQNKEAMQSDTAI